MSALDIPDRTCTRHGCVSAAAVVVRMPDGHERAVCHAHADDGEEVVGDV